MKFVRGTGRKVIRRCSRCAAVLNQYQVGTLCFSCQQRESERLTTDDNPNYDVNDMARILGLKSTEQVRRLARTHKLPPCIPSVKRRLWSKEIVDQWIRSKGQLPQGAAEQLAVLGDAHGGWHVDKASGQLKVGRPETVTPERFRRR